MNVKLGTQLFFHALVLLLLATIVMTVSLILHELTHFVVALGFGAKDVKFTVFNVTIDEASISQGQMALVSIAGPFFTVAITLASLFAMRSTYSKTLLLISLIAPIRALATMGFVIFSLRGISDREFTGVDEWEFATNIGISPWYPILISLFVLFLSWYISIKKIVVVEGWKMVPIYILAIVLGIYAFGSFVGPMLSPGQSFTS